MDCAILSHGINISKTELRDCCVQRESSGSPFIMEIENPEKIDLDKIFELKRKLKNEKLNNPKMCKGCLYLEENADLSWERDYISIINFDHWNICNSRCIYCSEEHNGGDFYFNVLPMIKNLVSSGRFLPTGEITFQGGEPTLLPEFEELLDIFIQNNAKIRIYSSGIKYSKSIENGIAEQLVTLVVSPDTGKKETYETIKRNPHFDDVWDNLKKYSSFDQENFVKAKMLVVPHYNDSIDEVDAFVDKVKSSNVKTIVIDAEGWYSNKYGYNLPHIRFLIEYMKNLCLKNNINFECYDNAQFVVNNQVLCQIPTDYNEILQQFEALKNQYISRSVDYL